MRLKDLGRERIGICVSVVLIARRLRRDYWPRDWTSCYSADLGQPDEENIEDIRTKMATTGAETEIVDLKTEMAEACFFGSEKSGEVRRWLLEHNRYRAGCDRSRLLRAMKADGCTVLSHGATGRGNDQVRFERYTNVLAPDMKVYAPWRDPGLLEQFPGRREMVAYLREKGIEADVVPRRDTAPMPTWLDFHTRLKISRIWRRLV